MNWLRLAAAPTFALMALLTALLEGSAGRVTCLGMAATPITSMSLMYLLMSVFHAAARVRLLALRSGRRLGRRKQATHSL